MEIKITHEMAVLYLLFQQHKIDREVYLPPSAVDVGDVLIEPLNIYVFTTWKTPARLTDIYQDNPDLLQRIQVKSRSGSNYYKYRLNINFIPELIKDKKLKTFFEYIGGKYEPQKKIETKYCQHGLPTFVQCPNCCGKV